MEGKTSVSYGGSKVGASLGGRKILDVFKRQDCNVARVI